MTRMASAQTGAMALVLGQSGSRSVDVACPATRARVRLIAAGAAVRRSHEGGPPQDRRP